MTPEELRNPNLVRLHGIVRDVVKKTNDIGDAVEKVYAKVKKSNPLAVELQEWAWRQALRELVHHMRHQIRGRLKFQTSAETQRTGSVIEATRLALDRSLLRSFTMPDGRVLGRQTPADLRAFASVARREAEGKILNAEFWEELADRGKDGVVISESITEEDARQVLDDVIGKMRQAVEV